MSFIIPADDEFKNKMMKSAADILKQFRTRMARIYVYGREDEPAEMYNPPVKYKFITQEQWNEFVKLRLSPEFKVKEPIIILSFQS